MEQVFEAMTIPDLEKFKKAYAKNESIAKIVDGYIETRVKEQAKAQEELVFKETVANLATNLPHPEDVMNIYLAWREVEQDDTSQEPELVEVVVQEAVVDDKGIITTPAVIEAQPRYPQVKVPKWEVELNKGFSVGKSATNTTPSSNKRATTIYKRNGTSNELVGNFRTYAEACRHLRFPCAGSLGGTDSGERVLTREGYVHDDYSGTDFIVPS